MGEDTRKFDCFAMGINGKSCLALKELYCKKVDSCPFYKSKKQVEKEKEKYGTVSVKEVLF